jgi:hypothetical protein
LFVYVGSTCALTGTTNQERKSCISVYFGPGSSHNIVRILPETHATSVSSQIQAAIAALHYVRVYFCMIREGQVRGPRELEKQLMLADGWTMPAEHALQDMLQFRLIIASTSKCVENFVTCARFVWKQGVENNEFRTPSSRVVSNGELYATLLLEIELTERARIPVEWSFVQTKSSDLAALLATRFLAKYLFTGKVPDEGGFAQQPLGVWAKEVGT